MSRIIKFRAWHKTLKKLLYAPLSLSSDNLCIDKEGNYAQFLPKKNWRNQDKLYLEANLDWRGNWYENGELQDAVFQQYTGLKDKNGQEIYEGDILKHQYSPSENESTSVVRWSEEGEDNHPGFCITRLMTQGGEMTVIGNIFENPELLK